MSGPDYPIDVAPAVNMSAPVRTELRLIADMIPPQARVLDVGAETGDLLAYLWQTKNVDGRGIELSMAGVRASVARGLSVIQGDADTDLADFPDEAFDYVVLSQTLQATRNPRLVLEHLLRIGRRAIVSFPNFGYWRVRLSLLATGRMPRTSHLPSSWYDTPNIHFCTIRDLTLLCRELSISIERSIVLTAGNRAHETRSGRWANWFGRDAIYLLRKN